ncbi:hypothetical protein HWV62_14096 [Athelia sp. TMB]|nr:hypothetical protein HWV62_14096 [Athelia sp. TMB]
MYDGMWCAHTGTATTLQDGGVRTESLTSLRKEASEMIQGSLNLLSKSTATPIRISWKHYGIDMRETHKVQIVNWPLDKIKSPAEIDSIDDICEVCLAFRTGTAYWAPLTPTERKKVQRTVKARLESGQQAKPRAQRSDCGIPRGRQADKRKADEAEDKENEPKTKHAKVNKGSSSSRSTYKSKEMVFNSGSSDEGESE